MRAAKLEVTREGERVVADDGTVLASMEGIRGASVGTEWFVYGPHRWGHGQVSAYHGLHRSFRAVDGGKRAARQHMIKTAYAVALQMDEVVA